MNVAAGILGFFVTVIGWAIVGGALVLCAVIAGLHLYEAAVAVKRRLARVVDSTLGWWE